MPAAIICGFCSETVQQMNKWQTIEPLVEIQAVFYVQKEREKIKKYSIIYADPPWRYSAKKVQGAAENHYPTMSILE